MADGSGSTGWAYDSMGRALKQQQTIATVTKTTGYGYNYDGSLASLTYPSGRVIAYGVDSLGRPQSAVDQANGINYALNASYAPQGALASVLNGQTGSFGGITYSLGYNNRLWPSGISAASSSGTALSLAYSYFGNGNVNVITNNRDTGRTVTYGYDALNRISSAASQATSGADCWGQAIPSGGYDRYGNLLTINVTKCSAPGLSIGVNGNNQVSGYVYDLAGDVTNDGNYTYSWDAEGRMTAAGGTTYTYDGDGQRVKKSSGTLYWHGADGSVLAETDTSGNTLNEYVLFAGRTARRDSSGNVYYYFGNHLGSSTLTNATGSLCYDADFYPFGGELPFASSCAQNYKFAAMEQDTETPMTGAYHTMFRQYTPNVGRWLSPDPAGMGAASLTNPQSWNMYAYVMNNPTTLTDPLGLDSGDCSDWMTNPQCQGPSGGGSQGECGVDASPFDCTCPGYGVETAGGQCDPSTPSSPAPWWPPTPPPTPTVASLGGAGGGVWSENPGVNIYQPLSLYYLLGLPQPQLGCEFGPCNGLPGTEGNAWTGTSAAPNGTPCNMSGKLNAANKKAVKLFVRDMAVGEGAVFLIGCGIGAPAGGALGTASGLPIGPLIGLVGGCLGGGLAAAEDVLPATIFVSAVDASIEAYSGAFNNDCN